jgi:hypothetical protein
MLRISSRPPSTQAPAKKARMDDAPVVSAAGLRKPSPGFILPADGNLNALNNARIEVRPPVSVAGFIRAETRRPRVGDRRFARKNRTKKNSPRAALS